MAAPLQSIFLVSIALVWPATGPPVLARSQQPRRTAEPALSYLHNALLDHSPLVVKARFLSDRVLVSPSVQVTRFEIKAYLKGEGPREVMIAGMGERARAYRDLEKLLFMTPMKSGSMYRLVDLIDLTVEGGKAREDLVRFYLGLDKVENPMAARVMLKDRTLSGLSSTAPFVRRLAIHELERLARRRVEIFAVKDLPALDTAAKGLRPQDVRTHAEAAARVRAHLAIAFPEYERVFPEKRIRDAYLEASARLKRARIPRERVRELDRIVRGFGIRLRPLCEYLLRDQVRECADRAAWYLGEFGSDRSVVPLLRHLRGADAIRTKAIVEALGKIGDLAAVSVIKRLLERRDFLDVSILALGRIGGPDAENILLGLERVLSDTPSEKKRVERIQELRSETFRKRERQRRKEARARYMS